MRATAVLLLILLAAPVSADEGAARPWGIATAHPLATRAGEEILAAGGNAFDAAVAVSAALAVVEPYGSGLGGGGFWLLHVADDGREVMIDGRERAPLAASRTMYRNRARASLDGPLAAGIPGEPAALAHIAGNYGRLPLARSLRPAIRLAREGFAVDESYWAMARFRREVLLESPAAARVFLDGDAVPAVGWTLRQPDLAATLEALARDGRAGFYDGPVGERLVTGVRDAGGIWTRSDLRQYRVVERPPVVGRYRGMRIVSAAPPSSGGVALVETLNILAGHDLGAPGSADAVHLTIEAMRRAYHDRARHLGDPDFVDVPVARLTDRDYAAGRRASIRRDRATPSASFPAVETAAGGEDTTHFSIIGPGGNRVAATLSVNWPFGSGFMPPGTGVVLNDEMDDFAAKPGVPNVYGLVQGEANAVAPGKRMLSSMSPTFLEMNGRTAVVGTPGGSRIISMVLLAALEFHDGGGARDMVARGRYHHQYLPDIVQFEPGTLSTQVQAELRRRGHRLEARDAPYGDMQVVLHEHANGAIFAASDPRGTGSGARGCALDGNGGSRILRASAGAGCRLPSLPSGE